MRTHPDADAFMRAYLEQPADATARLVFADWLEETGEPHSIAWAHYIRLMIEAARQQPESVECVRLIRRADDLAPDIRAQLTISAKKFVDYPKSLLQLLPAPNITVRLAQFEIPRQVLEIMPESVARENLVIPLDLQKRTLLVASADPHWYDTWQKLVFILNRDIVFVRAEREDVQRAINHWYGQTEVEVVDSILVDFTATASPYIRIEVPLEITDGNAPVVRLVNLLLQESTNLHADRILLYPDIDAVGVRYHINGEWTERDRIPIRLLRPVTTHLAIRAQIDPTRVFGHSPSADARVGEFLLGATDDPLRIRVTIQPSPDGPITQIDLHRNPETRP